MIDRRVKAINRISDSVVCVSVIDQIFCDKNRSFGLPYLNLEKEKM